MMNEFEKLATELDKIECPLFALWYLLPKANEVLEKECESIDNYLLEEKIKELKKATKEIRELIAHELW